MPNYDSSAFTTWVYEFDCLPWQAETYFLSLEKELGNTRSITKTKHLTTDINCHGQLFWQVQPSKNNGKSAIKVGFGLEDQARSQKAVIGKKLSNYLTFIFEAIITQFPKCGKLREVNIL